MRRVLIAGNCTLNFKIMDLNSFKPVKRVNTTRSGEKPYDMKIEKDGRFNLTSKAYGMLSLHDNSLEQFNSPDGVALVVMPGQSGTFAKGVSGKQKGGKFKNETLLSDLRARGIQGNYLKLTFIGERDNMRYFQITEAQLSEAEAQEQEAESQEA